MGQVRVEALRCVTLYQSYVMLGQGYAKLVNLYEIQELSVYAAGLYSQNPHTSPWRPDVG